MLENQNNDTPFAQLKQILTNTQTSFIGYSGCIILLNLLVTYLRPQEIIEPLGKIKLPLFLTILCFLFFAVNYRQNWTKQTKLLAIFIAYLGVYGFIGKVIYDPLIRNDFRSFWTWADLTMGVFGLSLPIAAVFAGRKALKMLAFFLSLTGVLLAAYASTHSGHGPKGWVWDENDCCFTLLSLFPFCVFFIQNSKSYFVKFIHCTTALICLCGMVSTMSRGGFIGLVVVLGYMFYHSQQKIKLLFVAIVIACLALPLVPQNYWDEMKTIKNVKEGTAAKRTDYWVAALKVWLLPGNIIIGVGPSNSPFWLGDVQEASAGTEYGVESFSGRQVHSMYFQLLSELGLVGIYFFVAIIGGTLTNNRNVLKYSQAAHNRINRLIQLKLISADNANVPQNLCVELKFCALLLAAINTSIIGGISSGAFISVLYYPPLWVLVGVSAAVQGYAIKISSISKEFENSLLKSRGFVEDIDMPTITIEE